MDVYSCFKDVDKVRSAPVVRTRWSCVPESRGNGRTRSGIAFLIFIQCF